MPVLPSPSTLAPLPAFDAWYPHQDETVSRILDWLSRPSPRFLCVEAPTGAGKSLIGMLSAHLSRKRTVTLTATKGLQSQLLSDFGGMLSDIRGQNSYSCRYAEDQRQHDVSVEDGICHAGFSCDYADKGCFYFDRLREALRAPITTTNYAYWLSQTNHGRGLGDVDLLICDEAHLAFGALESYLSFTLFKHELDQRGMAFTPPTSASSLDDWKDWSRRQSPKMLTEEKDLVGRVAELKEEEDGRGMREAALALKRTRSLQARLSSVGTSAGPWVWEPSRTKRTGVTFSPVWPARYSHHLFHDVPKVLLMSAVLTPKTADLLGVKEDDREFLRQPSSFPPHNTPIYHIPTVRLNHRSSDADQRLWVNRIDQIIDRRLDRKGVVFTVSYARRDLVLSRSRHSGIMITHSTKDVFEKVRKFKLSPAPSVLVSPAVTSGWDFPGDECSYIIIGKVPWPDTQPPVVKARNEEDPDWAPFTAMQTMVQESGRGSRSPEDKCEVFVVDDNWTWVMSKYKGFAPQWFQQRVRGKRMTVPEVAW